MSNTAAPAESFGVRLRRLRTANSMTQRELGELIGTHHTNIGRYEREAVRPRIDMILALADALNVSPEYLQNGAEPNHKSCDEELFEQYEMVQKLPSEDREVVKLLVESFILRRQIEDLVEP